MVEVPVGTYFFHARNREAFHKRTMPLELAPMPWTLLPTIGIGMALIIAFATVAYTSNPHVGWLLLAVGAVVVGSLPFWVAAHANTRLNERAWRKGKFCTGEIESCVSVVPWGKARQFQIRLTYLFRSPKGILIRRITTQKRPNLNGQPLPSPGTSVMVLYFSDGEYYLL
jgi:hypothetical protein